MNNLTAANATHHLMCAHAIGPKYRMEYIMRCHILKDMGDGRVKVLVFGERNWKHKEHISRIRYVLKERIIKHCT